jgi:uncharacterized protein (TIGR00297 family)
VADRLISQIAIAASVTAAFAAVAYGLGMVSRGGALGGFPIGTVVYASLGAPGFTVLALFVIGGSLLTRLGYGRKRRAGIAEGGGGRRGAANALANCGIAVVCALAYSLTSLEPLAAAFVASLGAAFADTAESEIGGLYGRDPRLITNMKVVLPGTDGAVSMPGTLAGLAAAGLTAGSGLALGLVSGPAAAVVVALAAYLGSVADSLIGALAPRVGNELTNVTCTLVAAVLALSFV